MNISDEIKKLAELNSSGALTDQEFIEAKKKVLSGSPHSAKLGTGADLKTSHSTAATSTSSDPSKPTGFGTTTSGLPSGGNPFTRLPTFDNNTSLGHAANRWVSLQSVMAWVGLVIFCIMGMFMCSRFSAADKRMEKAKNQFPSQLFERTR